MIYDICVLIFFSVGFWFQRWGRIGTVGQYQRTPFNNVKDAISEFEKIFRSKTGNLWANRDNFEKKARKYTLINLKRTRIRAEDLLKPFDFGKAPNSNLPGMYILKNGLTICLFYLAFFFSSSILNDVVFLFIDRFI
jgi:predicted DNA-binding WGR domain protein